MKTHQIATTVKRLIAPVLAGATAVLFSAGANATSASAPSAVESQRFDRGMQVLRDLNNGQPQPVFEAMRQEFPFLAESTASYALGDVWGRQVLDPKTRQLASMAAFAALGLRGFFKTHAGYALNMGVPPEQLKEIVYLITVPAGFPRAIEASQTLQELFVERGLNNAPGARP